MRIGLAMAWALRNRGLTAILLGARNTAHIDNAFDALELDVPASWMDEMNSWQNLLTV
jgi:aryl-alcohol dehydrogenase-like predicted oxidoreductase